MLQCMLALLPAWAAPAALGFNRNMCTPSQPQPKNTRAPHCFDTALAGSHAHAQACATFAICKIYCMICHCCCPPSPASSACCRPGNYAQENTYAGNTGKNLGPLRGMPMWSKTMHHAWHNCRLLRACPQWQHTLRLGMSKGQATSPRVYTHTHTLSLQRFPCSLSPHPHDAVQAEARRDPWVGKKRERYWCWVGKAGGLQND